MQQPLVAALRWTAGLAGMVIVVVLAAACGSGSPSASSAPSAPADVSVALGKLVQYLHTHGGRGVYLRNAPASPNPDSILIIFHGFAVRAPIPARISSARPCRPASTCCRMAPRQARPNCTTRSSRA